MCIETFDVSSVSNEREAYEVSQFLLGNPHIDKAMCDIVDSELIVEYDERELDRDSVLDEIEYAGCTPDERRSPGVIGRLFG